MTRLILQVVFLIIKVFKHSFIHLLLFLYFQLYLNTCNKEFIHLFTIIRKKKFVQNNSKYSIAFRKLLVKKKCINDDISKILFRFGQDKWIGEDVYCAKKIQLLLCSTPLVTGIIQFADMSISKAILKNFKEVKFRFLLESLFT